MSDDIVERLRACHGISSGDPECCCQEAADEIECLRAERDFNRGQARALEAHNNELRAEIERMREALRMEEKIATRQASTIESMLEDLDRATRARGQRVAE